MSHLLPEQDVHDMRDELLVATEDVLCLGMDSSPFEVVYAECRNLPFGGRVTHDSRVRVPRKEYARVATNVYLRKTSEKLEKT